MNKRVTLYKTLVFQAGPSKACKDFFMVRPQKSFMNRVRLVVAILEDVVTYSDLPAPENSGIDGLL